MFGCYREFREFMQREMFSKSKVQVFWVKDFSSSEFDNQLRNHSVSRLCFSHCTLNMSHNKVALLTMFSTVFLTR